MVAALRFKGDEGRRASAQEPAEGGQSASGCRHGTLDAFIRVDNRFTWRWREWPGIPSTNLSCRPSTTTSTVILTLLPRQEDILKENYQDLCQVIKAVEEKRASKAVFWFRAMCASSIA